MFFFRVYRRTSINITDKVLKEIHDMIDLSGQLLAGSVFYYCYECDSKELAGFINVSKRTYKGDREVFIESSFVKEKYRNNSAFTLMVSLLVADTAEKGVVVSTRVLKSNMYSISGLKTAGLKEISGDSKLLSLSTKNGIM